MSEIDRLNFQAVGAIAKGDYSEAIKAVSVGSGDILILAVLSVARELERLVEVQSFEPSPRARR